MKKQIEITKLERVEIPTEHQFDNIIAVQMIKFKINFFGSEDEFYLDSRIYADGRQEITDGNGWIPQGYEIN